MRLLAFTLLLTTTLTSAEDYQCSAEEFYWQQAHSQTDDNIKSPISCELYWPQKINDYRFIQVGYTGLNIKNALQLSREEAVAFIRLKTKEQFIIIDEDAIMVSNNYWCQQSKNTQVLAHGIAGVPSALISGNWLIDAAIALKAVKLGGYQLVSAQDIHGSLDDFIRVSSKTIVFDDNLTAINQLSKQYRDYLSRRVFFANMNSDDYLKEQRKAFKSAKTYSQAPKRYTCQR